MTDTRPVLIGMNNPYGSDPRHALYPLPERSAGGRLYAMLRAAHDFRYPDAGDRALTMREYANAFDRRNVLSSKQWSLLLARVTAARLLPDLNDRRVVLLGRQVAAALGLPRTEWFERQTCTPKSPLGTLRFRAWTIPHPSGMCREYNDPYNRRRAGTLLLDLMEGREPYAPH